MLTPSGLDIDTLLPPGVTPIGADKIDVDAEIAIPHVPTPLSFCVALPGRNPKLEPSVPELTGKVPAGRLVRGRHRTGANPMAAHFEGNTPFDVDARVVAAGDVLLGFQDQIPVDFAPFTRASARLALRDVPNELTALVALPGKVTRGDQQERGLATRALITAPGASKTRVHVEAALEDATARCDNAGTLGSLVCGDIDVEGLPETLSVISRFDGGTGATPTMAASTCDLDVFATTPTCRSGSAVGGIDTVNVRLRTRAGNGHSVPLYVPPSSGPSVYMQGAIDKLGGDDDIKVFDLDAGLRLGGLHDLLASIGPNGLLAKGRLGTGTAPLVTHGYTDLTNMEGLPDGLSGIVGTVDATLTPLPAALDLTVGLDPNGEQPMSLDLLASDGATPPVPTNVNVDAAVDVRLRNEAGAAGAVCGDPLTLCGTLRLHPVPGHIHATLDRSESGPDDLRTAEHVLRVQLDAPVSAASATDPNLDLNLVVGLPDGLPILGGKPLFVHGRIFDLPEHATVALATTGASIDRVQAYACKRKVQAGVCATGTTGSIGLIDVRAATFDATHRPTGFPVLAVSGDAVLTAAGRGDNLEARMLVRRLVGVDLVPAAGAAGAHADLAPAPVGGSKTDRLAVAIDVRDFPLPLSIDVLPEGRTLVKPKLDFVATATVAPFPDTIDICFSEPLSGRAPIEDIPAAVAQCVDGPIGGSGKTLGVAVNANDPTHSTLAITADVDATLRGTDAATNKAAPPIRLLGHAQLTDVPENLTFHLLPQQTRYDAVNVGGELRLVPRAVGKMQARLTSGPTKNAPGIDVNAALLVGDRASCEDSRPDVVAVCLDAGLSGLPTSLDFTYDPAAPTDNFHVDVDGPDDTLRVDELHISAVGKFLALANAQAAADTIGQVVATDALIADVEIEPTALPFGISGTLRLPQADGELPRVDLEVDDGNTLPKVTLHVRNFTTPDLLAGRPTLETLPARPVQRVVDGTPEPAEHRIVAVQEERAVRIEAQLAQLKRVVLEPVIGSDHKQVGTLHGLIGFAADQNVRIFADLQHVKVPGLPVISALVDTLIEGIPANTELCIRPPGAPPQPGSLPATWCGTAPGSSGEGALEIRRPRDATPVGSLDVDVFARLGFGGGTDVLAGRIDIDGIPEVIRAVFPASSTGKLEIETLGLGETGTPYPRGIGQIDAEIGTGDLPLDSTGYTDAAKLPYDAQPLGITAKAADPGEDHLHVKADLKAGVRAHVTAHLGTLGDASSAHFQHLLVDLGHPCAKPPTGARPDYPAVPIASGDRYVCALLEIDDGIGLIDDLFDFDLDLGGVLDPPPATPRPFSIDAEVALPGDGANLRLRDAELSTLPPWVQLQLANGPLFANRAGALGWRQPCRGEAEKTSDLEGDAACAPPMIRFDQPLADLTLHGVLESDSGGMLATLNNATPRSIAPNFDSVPTGAAWDWTKAGAVDKDPSDDAVREGILVKAVYDTKGTENGKDDRFALRAPFRMVIPQSITIDQPTFFDRKSDITRESGAVATAEAHDLRIHFAARDEEGELFDAPGTDSGLGSAAAFLEESATGIQVLLTAPCAGDTPRMRDASVDEDGDRLVPLDNCLDGTSTTAAQTSHYDEGFTLPSELGLDLYRRTTVYKDNWNAHDTLVKGGLPFLDDGKSRTRTSTFLQLDGRVSSPINIGARLLGSGADLFPENAAIQVRLGDMEFRLQNLPATKKMASPNEPSFRVRIELMTDETNNSVIGTALENMANFVETLAKNARDDDFFKVVPVLDLDIGGVSAGLDLHPLVKDSSKPLDDPKHIGPQARRVDLVAHVDAPKIGLDLVSTDSVFGGDPAPIDLGFRARADHILAGVYSQLNLQPLKAAGPAMTALKDQAIAEASAAMKKAIVDSCRLVFSAETCTDIGSSFDELMEFAANFQIPFTDIKLTAFLDDLIVSATDAAVDAAETALNLVGLDAHFEGRFAAQIELKGVQRLVFGLNALHAEVEKLEPDTARLTLGPFDLFIDDLFAGADLRLPPIPVPDFLHGIGFPKEFKLPKLDLLGLGYHQNDFNPVNLLPAPLDIRFIGCGVVEAALPLLDDHRSVSFTGVGVRTGGTAQKGVAIWPFSDGSIGMTGLLGTPLRLAAELAAASDPTHISRGGR